MLKKTILTIFLCFLLQPIFAADLIDVYIDASHNDPFFQEAIAQRLATKQGVPISLAQILPNISAFFNPSITRTGIAGTNLARFDNFGIAPRNTTTRAYTLSLTITQTIFNVSQFFNIAGAFALSKGADATLNAALQDLMIRTANAYFNILRDEDNLQFNAASKKAYQMQLNQIKNQYQVGLRTNTEVYTAKAAYDLSVANYIAAETTLNNDKENLRVITGQYYEHLNPLSDKFPLVKPVPANIEEWVRTAECQNWTIKSQQFNVRHALQVMRQQYGGFTPTVNFQGTLDRLYSLNMNGYNTLLDKRGPSTQTDRQAMIVVNTPIFSGGSTTAQTMQAKYYYQSAQAQLEQTIRNTINLTRQSYLEIMLGISKIKSDKQAVKSTLSSLHGLEAGYQVGTQTLVDVINQQQKVLQAQTQYATDRYRFVTNMLALKQAAGILSFDDIKSINHWLLKSH